METRRTLLILSLATVALAAPARADEKDDETVAVYKVKCASCHMPDGNSPLEPLNFVDGKWAHGSTHADVAKVISDGVQGTAMLPFKTQLTPEQVKALAEYVRSFDKTLKPEKANKK